MARMEQKMMGRRAFLGGVLSTGALVMLSACTSGAGGRQGSADVAVQPLTIGLTRPASVDPALACDLSSLIVTWQLFDALTVYDAAFDGLECLSADRYEVSDDACTFTFYLRESTFHDGTPVTSADFKRAWERIVDPASVPNQVEDASAPAYLLSLIDGYDALRSGSSTGLAGVTCPDDTTLAVRLSTPYADFPYLLAHPALGPVPRLAADDPESFALKPIGNGPFMMTDAWKSGSGSISLARYEGYAGVEPHIDAARLDIEASISDSFQALQTDDVDVSCCPIDEAGDASSSLGRSEDGRTLEQGSRFAVVTNYTTSMLACNCASEPMSDSVVRRAVSLAVDRAYLCDTLYRKTRVAADDIVTPAMAGYREGAWTYAAYDKARAEELLDSAYPRNDDGKRDLTLRLSYDAAGGHAEVMKAIIKNLSDVGISCRSEALESSEFTERLAAGDFDLARVDWTADAPSMDTMLFPLFFSGNSGDTNLSRFESEQVDEWLVRARLELDEDARRTLLQDADDAVALACPVIPLMYHARTYAASRRVQYLAVGPQGRIDLATAELAE